MPAKVKFMPKDASPLSPYLVVSNAAKLIDFYKQVLGATETMRLNQPDGRVGHAELKINGSTIMLADEFPEMGIVSPNTIGAARSPVGIQVYVQDVDAVYKSALAHGATSMHEPADQFYGDRNAQVKDPSGHVWFFATHIEDVSTVEVQERLAKMATQER
jgi:PhnB protein